MDIIGICGIRVVPYNSHIMSTIFLLLYEKLIEFNHEKQKYYLSFISY